MSGRHIIVAMLTCIAISVIGSIAMRWASVEKSAEDHKLHETWKLGMINRHDQQDPQMGFIKPRVSDSDLVVNVSLQENMRAKLDVLKYRSSVFNSSEISPSPQTTSKVRINDVLSATGGKMWRETETKCDSCPIFITMAVLSKQNRTTSGLRGALKYDNSSEIFLSTIQATANSMGNAHRCFKFYIYTDDSYLQNNLESLGLGQQVIVRSFPKVAVNVYDIYLEHRRLNGSVPIFEMKPKDVQVEPLYRDWLSISRSKLDLVKLHLDVGEKVIWIDLDTLVVADFSCFYLLPNFVNAPGFWQESFSILNEFMPLPLPKQTQTGRKTVKVRYRGPQYAAYQGIPSKHFVFGDLWMADQALIDAALGIEQELFQKGLFATYDVQHYFSLLHYRNMTGLHDLNRETDMCWGMQFVEGNRLPWARSLMHLGGVGEDLYCTKTCKKVGALSFNWASFQVMRTAPCLYFKESTGALAWFRKHVARWGYSVVGGLAHIITCGKTVDAGGKADGPHVARNECVTVNEMQESVLHRA